MNDSPQPNPKGSLGIGLLSREELEDRLLNTLRQLEQAEQERDRLREEINRLTELKRW